MVLIGISGDEVIEKEKFTIALKKQLGDKHIEKMANEVFGKDEKLKS